MELNCKNCFYDKHCPRGYDDGCHRYLDKRQVVVLPKKASKELHQELVNYCYTRCIDEE